MKIIEVPIHPSAFPPDYGFSDIPIKEIIQVLTPKNSAAFVCFLAHLDYSQRTGRPLLVEPRNVRSCATPSEPMEPSISLPAFITPDSRNGRHFPGRIDHHAPQHAIQRLNKSPSLATLPDQSTWGLTSAATLWASALLHLADDNNRHLLPKVVAGSGSQIDWDQFVATRLGMEFLASGKNQAFTLLASLLPGLLADEFTIFPAEYISNPEGTLSSIEQIEIPVKVGEPFDKIIVSAEILRTSHLQTAGEGQLLPLLVSCARPGTLGNVKVPGVENFWEDYYKKILTAHPIQNMVTLAISHCSTGSGDNNKRMKDCSIVIGLTGIWDQNDAKSFLPLIDTANTIPKMALLLMNTLRKQDIKATIAQGFRNGYGRIDVTLPKMLRVSGISAGDFVYELVKKIIFSN